MPLSGLRRSRMLVVLGALFWLASSCHMPGYGPTVYPDDPVIHASDCVDVPQSLVGEIEASVVTMEPSRVIGGMLNVPNGEPVDNSFRIRLDDVDFSNWVALPAPPDHEPKGYWVAAQADGTHSWARPDQDEWTILNNFHAYVLFFKPQELSSSDRVVVAWDEFHGYRTRMTHLEDASQGVDISIDDRGTLARCLGHEGPLHAIAQSDEPWIFTMAWSEISDDREPVPPTTTTVPRPTFGYWIDFGPPDGSGPGSARGHPGNPGS